MWQPAAQMPRHSGLPAFLSACAHCRSTEGLPHSGLRLGPGTTPKELPGRWGQGPRGGDHAGGKQVFLETLLPLTLSSEGPRIVSVSSGRPSGVPTLCLSLAPRLAGMHTHAAGPSPHKARGAVPGRHSFNSILPTALLASQKRPGASHGVRLADWICCLKPWVRGTRAVIFILPHAA